MASIRVSLRLGGPEVTSCTGFLWAFRKENYLITNWHCFTGWDPIENKPISKMGFRPEVAVPFLLYKAGIHDVPIDLRGENGPNWLQHPTFGRDVDVAAIKVPPNDGVLISIPANEVPCQPLDVFIADDAFVLGFPMGLHAGELPIWKRASVATEPRMDEGGYQKSLSTPQRGKACPVLLYL